MSNTPGVRANGGAGAEISGIGLRAAMVGRARRDAGRADLEGREASDRVVSADVPRGTAGAKGAREDAVVSEATGGVLAVAVGRSGVDRPCRRSSFPSSK
jgi:hypothetical protein